MNSRVMQNIPLFKIRWDIGDLNNTSSAIRKGINWAAGEYVERFEALISRYLGVRYCVVFNSGTSALHSLLLAYGIGNGDKVIVPSFTFISTANAPLFVGAECVFADIEEETFGLSPQSIKDKITKRTKAIIVVHYGGSPCRMKEIERIARTHNLILLEDAAEAFGAKLDDRRIGTFGDAAIFSFCQNKIITTGDGGCAVTGSRDIYEKLKLIRSHGEMKNAGTRQNYVSLGFNFRMSNITAALGISQLKKTEENIRMRRRIARYITEKLSNIKELKLPSTAFNPFNIYQMYPIMTNARLRDGLAMHLARKGIASKVYFHPVHLSSFFRKNFGYRKGLLPATESVSRRILCLPIYPTLKKQDVDYIARNIENFFNKKRR